MGFGEFPGGLTHPHAGRVTHPNFTGAEAPALRALPDLALHTSSSGCSSVSFIISFNELVDGSKCFPEFCEPLSQINQT